MEIKLPRCVSARKFFALITVSLLIFGFMTPVTAETEVADKGMQLILGEKLYFDANLSINGNQSCNTCHSANPIGTNSVGTFVDDRLGLIPLIGWPADIPLPVSQGSDLNLFGGRNTPSSAYAAFSPAFRFDEVAGLYVGGQFWDGREMSLSGQAAGPFRNPVEMAMADKKAVVIALQADRDYQRLFRAAYEDELGVPFNLSAVNTRTNQAVLEAYDLMAKAIGEFEKTQRFNKFNSRYDYYLAGLPDPDGPFTKDELKGLKLFEGKGKCALCHISQAAIAPDGGAMPPLFTDFTYDNLGVPTNLYIADLAGPQALDFGLGGVLNDPLQDGKFKVMTLRNIELTAPYAHNGVFQTLEQIVHFYNTRDVLGVCVDNKDPGFGVTCWPAPEVPANVNVAELGNLKLKAKQEAQLVAFLKTLSDRDLFAYPSVFSEAAFPPMP